MTGFSPSNQLEQPPLIVGIAQFASRQRENNWLVVSTPLKNMKVSWDDEIPN
jgi:hypothetical protein